MTTPHRRILRSKKKKSSPKRHVEESLLSDTSILRDFIDGIPDAVYFKDQRGRFIFVNKAWIGMVLNQGILLDGGAVGKTDRDIFPAGWARRQVKEDQAVLKTGKSIVNKVEQTFAGKGAGIPFSVTKIPRYNSQGKIVGLMGLTRDITQHLRFERVREEKLLVQERKLEMLETLNEAKSKFISTVSHELRTPLAIVKQLLLLVFDEVAGPINDQQREILVKARYNLDRLKGIIDELLDMARIERKKFNLYYSLVNLKDLILESQDFFKQLAAEKNLQIIYDYPSMDINIFIDAERVHQVILNLVSNAIKFTPENGKIKVEVQLLETKVRVGIIDSGLGISKKDAARIFGKFVQGSSPDKEKVKGIGLGLSIVKEIVEKHGGEVWAESQPKTGSKFYFTLPRFYTADIVAKNTQDQVNRLLEKGVSVYLINLLIVNYEEFKKRVDIVPAAFFEELRSMIKTSFREVFDPDNDEHLIDLPDMKQGRYSIIFPETDSDKVAHFCHRLREKTKKYFIGHSINGVFIALGMLFYSHKIGLQKNESGPNLHIKEIYIGSEVRRFKRINYMTDVELLFPGEPTQKVETIDISAGGVCLFTTVPLKTDKKIKLKINLLRKKYPITAIARVAWIKKMDPTPLQTFEQYKVGVEFIRMTPTDRRVLSEELKLYYE